MSSSKDPLFRYLARPSRRRLGRVVAAHYRQVWELALRLTGNEDDASDITQDVFLGLVLDPPEAATVRSAGGFLAWRVIGHTSRLRRALERRRRREEEHARRLAREVAGSEALRRDDVDAVRESLDTLPEDDRVTLELRYLAGLSAAETARVLGIGERAVRLRLERARDRLRDRLSPLFAGALIAGGAGLAEAASPPVGLLGRLLHAVEAAEALAPVAGTAAATSAISSLGLGGIIVSTKKAIATAVVGALVLGGAAFYVVSNGFGRGAGSPDDGMGARPIPVGAGERHADDAGTATPAAARLEPATDGVVVREEAAVPPSIHGRVLSRGDGGAVGGAEVWALDDAAWTTVGAGNRGAWGWVLEPERELAELRGYFASLLDRAPKTASDDEGRYAFGGLAPGAYRLVVLAAGFLPGNETVVEHDGGTTERDVELFAGATLAGRVVDAGGRPVAGAEIVWRPSSDPAAGGGALLVASLRKWEEGLFVLERDWLSGEDGHFEIPFVEPGRYDVVARRLGSLPAAAWNVDAGADEAVLVLESGLAIEGRLVDARGAAVAGAVIDVVAGRNTEVHRFFDRRVATDRLDEVRRLEASSGADGRFLLSGVSPGHWDLRASAPARAPLARQLVLDAESIDLGDLVLDEPHAVAGRVTDRDGLPIEGARVWAALPLKKIRPANSISRDVPEPLVVAESGTDGSFRLDGLPAGVLDVVADHPDRALAMVTGVETGSTGIAIVLEPGVTIRGRVVADGTGESVPDAKVAAGFGYEIGASTDEDGRFELRGLSFADTYRGEAHLRVNHEEFDPEQVRVQLQAHDPARELVVRLRQVERVDGRVVDADGAAIRGAFVTFVVRGLPPGAAGYNPARGIHAFSAADGGFSLRAPVGLRNMIGDIRLSLETRRRGYAPASYDFPSLPPTGRPWPFVELVLESAARVEGVVRDAAGHGVAGARIDALSEAEIDAMLETERSVSLPSAFTDGRGRFELGDLAEGPVRVRVRARGFAPVVVTAVATAVDDVAPIEITLEGGGELAGRVVAEDGTPLEGAEVAAFPSILLAALRQDPTQPTERFTDRMFLRIGPGLSRTRSGAGGGFVVGELPDGVFALVARAPGYEAAVATDLRPGDRVPDFVLERFSAVGGVVLDALTRAPLRRFTLNFVNVDVREQMQRRSGMRDTRLGSEGALVFQGPHGRFFYDGLRAGRYELTVTADDHVFHVAELTLAAGEEREMEILLDAGGAIDVEVVYAGSGAPVEGAIVAAFHQGEGNLFRGSRDEVFSDADGRCRLAGLREGEYFVSASHPHALRDSERRTTVEVGPEGTAAVTVVMGPAGRLEGSVNGLADRREGRTRTRHRLVYRRLDEGENADEERRRTMALMQSIHLNADGRFQQDAVPPGVYRLVLVSQEREEGEMLAVGPTSGFSTSKPVGPETERVLGEVTIEAGRTTVFEHDVGGE